MKRQIGFTLVELMVVIAIVGILAVTAVPVYRTWMQRTYGSEASLMMKSLIDGQIMYFLDYNKFFPGSDTSIQVFEDDPPSKPEIQQIKDALGIGIRVGHNLSYDIQAFPATADDSCTIVISAPFPLFSDGSKQLIGNVDKTGKAYIFTAG
jgi:prepilin-type N-terminal cleavage/methylation domain-containing protein